MTTVRVVSPGPFTTVQDLGRPGYAALGISACGAADAVALRLGNRLVGNPASAPALEMTLLGATLQFVRATVIALAGAPCAASRAPSNPAGKCAVAVPMWTAVSINPGEVLRCGAIHPGARTYLGIAGGIAVPLVLGSASTHVRSGLGGLQGRALRAGDELDLAQSWATPPSGHLLPEVVDRLYPPGQPRWLHVTDGPQQDRCPADALTTLLSADYVVSAHADRMGIRLVGPALARWSSAERQSGGAKDELLTEGVYLGAMQVPADGQPILLSVDHQTTGGYPKIASVIAADLAILGQLRPADRVRFVRVSLEEADARLVALTKLLADPGLVVT